MARGNSRGGRNTRRIASVAAPRRSPNTNIESFDTSWLSRIRENPGVRLVDLMRYEDRRRYSPDTIEQYPKPSHTTARGWLGKPRIVIVPEGHKLAKYQTYGGRYSLRDVWHGKTYRESDYYAWERDPKFGRESNRLYKGVSRRLGFHAPWQVVICVRRKRRREVMHALRIAGKRGVGRGKTQRRNYYSQVRC